MGYVNLLCLYSMFAFFSIFGPKIVHRWGPKYLVLVDFVITRVSMVIGSLAYFIVVGANFFPYYGVQVPANIINGMGASILWTAQGVYLSRCALWDSRNSQKSTFCYSHSCRLC